MSTNLPITSGAPQTQAIAAKNTNGSNTADAADAQSSAPFGEVLAKQISNPQLKEAKVDVRLAVETLAQSTPIVVGREQAADAIRVEAVPADAAATAEDNTAAQQAALPTDMLAALMPQVANSMNPATPGTNAKSSAGTDPAQQKPASAATRAEVKGKNTVDTAAVIAKGNSPAAKAGEQSFTAAMIESANRAAATEFGTAMREAIPVPVATQPGTGTLASMQSTVASFAAPAVLAATQATINAPVGREKWGDEFAQKITWLTSSRQDQTAELHLNPPQLGPLDVVLKVSGDQATALFTSPHAAVREAIEQALPRLREMLADNGIALGNATVSDQTARDSGSEAARQKAADARNSPADSSSPAETQARVSQISRHNGIVDTFA
ncbi:MAG: flagellar hook-length control protein FliK [Gammaproteobacteria bacterium]|nr:flagellar hook-length control protein FliK [Gammaproteobacteria bacterium]MBU1968410.1 flagellar hook-length control protein FliK [Gammaproteobacteria bacterium]